ncbi:hypothetical protein [Octadecabacter antarcticus]|nr:hypothetical protein [Octadecabacter antarcticus]
MTGTGVGWTLYPPLTATGPQTALNQVDAFDTDNQFLSTDVF